MLGKFRSESPRLCPRSNGSPRAEEYAVVPRELESMALEWVKLDINSKPWEKRCSTTAWKPLYEAVLQETLETMVPKLGCLKRAPPTEKNPGFNSNGLCKWYDSLPT